MLTSIIVDYFLFENKKLLLDCMGYAQYIQTQLLFSKKKTNKKTVFTPPLFFHTEQNNISMTTHQCVILDNKPLSPNEKRRDVLKQHILALVCSVT